MSTDPGAAGLPPGPVTGAVFAATAGYSATLIDLENQAAQVASAPLRARIAEILRRLTARYTLLTGAPDAPLPPERAPQLLAELAAELDSLRGLDPSPVVADFASRAYHAAVAFSQEQLGPLAVDALPGALADDALSQALDSLPGSVAARIDDALRFAQQTPAADLNTAVLQPVAKANQAANTAEAAARWAVNRSVNTGVAHAAEQKDAYLLWAGETTACVHCGAHVGHYVRPGESFPTNLTFGDRPLTPWPDPDRLDGPPLHPNCLPGDALVASRSRITGATSRVFDGELVEIRTLADKVFAATPNHPVLTDRGWVAIGALKQGDYVIGTRGSERVVGTDQDDQDVPARIEEVAEAFLGSLSVSAREVPVTAEDFHGDGVGSQVAVVGTDRLLSDGPHFSLCEKHLKMLFQGTDMQLEALPSGSSPDEFALCTHSSADSGMGAISQSFPFLGRGLGHADRHRFATSPRLDPVIQQEATDRLSADSVDFCQRLLASSSDVELDEIVSVRRYPFSGHVYNLETEEGWYISNGIVTHNCRCRLIPWLGPVATHPVDTAIYNRPQLQDQVDLAAAMRREAKRAVLRGWSLPSESEAVRLRAADRLLRKGAGLPKSVEARARKAVQAKRFPDRHVR